MNEKIVKYLDDVRLGKKVNFEQYLKEEDVQAIKGWYKKYCDIDDFDVNKAVRLMSFLFFHENIDAYLAERYRETVTSLSEEYHFKYDDFRALFEDYRELVFG
jgi:hypothetical protein